MKKIKNKQGKRVSREMKAQNALLKAQNESQTSSASSSLQTAIKTGHPSFFDRKTSRDLPIINVKNTEGDPDTVAQVVIQNQFNNTPKVSVIIPVYNVEQYLRECLDSVVNQTLKEIEIICVDDGSTDKSLDILLEYAKKDNRITVLKQENLHAGVARNAGLAVARGEYLSFLDSDDFFELNMLEEMSKKADNDRSDIVVCGNIVRNEQLKEIVRQVHIDKTFSLTAPFSPTSYSDKLFTFCNPNPWTKLFKHSLFTENNIHFESYMRCNDITCVYTALAVANKISIIDTPFIFYRSNQKNNVTSQRSEQVDCFLYAIDKLEKKLKKLDLYQTFKQAFIDRVTNSFRWELSVCTDDQKQKIKEQAEKILSKNTYNILYSPKVSVIIPVYNVEQYLRECLDSVINQTLKDIEIICVNDGSPDNSLAILKEYAAKDKRIIIIDQKNQGLSCSRNNALKVAKGEYILFLDSDDWLRLDTCELLYKKAKAYKLDMLNFAGTNYNDTTKEYQQQNGQKISYISDNKDIYNRKELEKFMYNIPISACRFFYRREFLDNHNIRFPEGINFEDNYFVRKSLIFVENYGAEHEILYFRRVHGESITQNQNKFFNDYIEVTNRISDLYSQHNIDKNIAKKVIQSYCNTLYYQYSRFRKDDILKYRKPLFSFLRKMQKKYHFHDVRFNPNYGYYKGQLEQWWYRMKKQPLNLNNPRTFNEKIQWMKLYDSTPIKTRLADKYLVRDWVKEKIGEEYLIPLLGVYDKFEDIDFDKLPNQFVIKCNHGCAYNIIVRDKSLLDLQDTKTKLDKWIRENFAFNAGLELHYRDIKPKIIIEKYIENKGTNDLYDYKFWCFDGKVKYIQFLSERNLDGLKMAFYDRNWVKQNFVYSHPLDKKTIEKPSNLKLMIQLAEVLSKGFNHVRVDFYRLNDGTIYFGEMTFTSASGACIWNDESINQYFGSLIKLPKRAYNIDTGKYYKLHKPSIIKKYLLFPYYELKLPSLRAKYFAAQSKAVKNSLQSFRIDIKNLGSAENAVSITAQNAQISTPAWFTNAQGIGQVVNGAGTKQKLTIKAIKSGTLQLNFRGQDKRNLDNTRFPLWIDYKSIKIDGKELLSAPVATWHDKPYRYEMPVKDGQQITVEFEQQPHPYTSDELKDIILKLNPNSTYIKQNINKIAEQISGSASTLPEEKNSRFTSLKHFFYHKTETETCTKTYICGVRVCKKPADIYKFIDNRLAAFSKSIDTKFAELSKQLAQNSAKTQKDLLAKIADSNKIEQNNFASLQKDINNKFNGLEKEVELIKSNSLYTIKVFNKKMDSLFGMQNAAADFLSAAQKENRDDLLAATEELRESLLNNSAANRQAILEQVEKVLNLAAEQGKTLQTAQQNLQSSAESAQQAIIKQIETAKSNSASILEEIKHLPENIAQNSASNKAEILASVAKIANTQTNLQNTLQTAQQNLQSSAESAQQAIIKQIKTAQSSNTSTLEEIKRLPENIAQSNASNKAEILATVAKIADTQTNLQNILQTAQQNLQSSVQSTQQTILGQMEHIKAAVGSQIVGFETLQNSQNETIKSLLAAETAKAEQQFAEQSKNIIDFRNQYQSQYQELNFADLFHDTIEQSSWLKNKSFSLFGWAANYSFIYILYRILDKVNPCNILEMGLGQTTRLTSQYVAHKQPSAHLNVCEHNQDWINIYKEELPASDNIRINHFDLEYFDYDGKKNDKYKDMYKLANNQKFDLIIVDGPVGGGKNLPRSNILDLIKNDCIAEDFIIIFDDAERGGEKTTISKAKELLNAKNIEFFSFERNGIKRQHIITSQSREFVQYL